MNTKPIAIIGANGKTGRRVCSKLRSQGLTVRGLSRSTPTPFDWQNTATWTRALQGCRSAYITFQPDLAVPGADQAIAQLADVAREVGVEHLVLLSGRGEDGAQRAEGVLKQSGLDWNIVRSGWFAQNFSEGFMQQGIAAGTLALPAGNTPEPFIDVDDIADVVVALLTTSDKRNQLFEVSGPEALTFALCMQIISDVTGKSVQYVDIPIDAFISELDALGADNDVQWLMRELFTVVFDGRNSLPVDGVQQVLGRPATDFFAYAYKAAASGAWLGQPEHKMVV